MKDTHAAMVAERIFAPIDADYESDAAFERAVGLPDKTVNNWRRGRSSSYMKRLPMLAEAFHVTLGDLLCLPVDREEADLSEEEWHLVHLYRKARTLPKEQRRAMEETLTTVVKLYLSGPTPKTKEKRKRK